MNNTPDTSGTAAEPSPSGTTAAVATMIDDYFSRLRSAARAAHIRIDRDSLSELIAYVYDRLTSSNGTIADAERVLGELGTPESLARAYAAPDSAAPDSAASDSLAGNFQGADDADSPLSPRGALVGTLLGIPYDLRPPTSERYAARSWNPVDGRILVPKALGIGWSVNFGALAVRAHLVRPDDEDEPFAEVPSRVVAATLITPLAVASVFTAVAAASWSGLPAMVPSHWGLSGKPDRWSRRGPNLVLLAGFVAVPLAAAARVHLAGRPAIDRVAASAVSLTLGTAALGILAQTVQTVRTVRGSGRGRAGMWPIIVSLGGALVLPLVLLVGVSRVGRAAEQRRDLAAVSEKGPTK